VTAEIQSLKGLGFVEARKALPTIKHVFFEEPAEPFVPCSPAFVVMNSSKIRPRFR